MIVNHTLSRRFSLKIALLLLFATILSASAQEKITLEQAVEITLRSNLQIKQAQLSEALSQEDLKQSKLYFYPTLNARSDINFSFGRSSDPVTGDYVNQQITAASGNVSSSMPLFQGFRLWHQVSQFKYQLEADKSTTKKIQNDLALTVVTTYLQILSNQDLLTASQQQLELARLQLEREQKQFDVGSKTLADLSQAKATAATAELNVTTARNQLDIAYLNLAQLMERNPSDRFEVVRPVVDQLGELHSEESAADIYKQSVDRYPDITLARYRALAALKAVDVAKGDLLPRLSLGASMATNYSTRDRFVQGPDGVLVPYRDPFGDQISNNFGQTVGFTLSIPIFNSYSSRINLRKARITYENAKVSEQMARNDYNKVIYQAVTDLRAAESSYNSANSAFQSSKDAFNAIEQRYNVGLVNSLDFNQAQTDLNQKEFDLIQARYNLIFRNKIIDFYLGNPITF